MKVQSSIIHSIKKWKQSKCPLTDEWVNKIRCIHAMKYYFALRSNKVLMHAITWMNLENIVLNESQSSKNICCMIPFISNVHNRELYRDRK